MDRISFNPAAFKHGVTKEAILHAFTRVVYDHPMVGDAEKNLLIGFDRNANLLEVLYNVKGSERINVFHAMPCRKAWQHLADR